MRTFLLIISCALLVSSCTQSPERKAQATLQKFMLENSFEPSSYSPVETKVDSFFVDYLETSRGKTLKADIETLRAERTEVAQIIELTRQLDEERKTYRPMFYGWRVLHKYRARNGYGAIVLTEREFFLDPSFEIMDLDTISL